MPADEILPRLRLPALAGLRTPDAVAEILDSIPCGVLVLDRARRIRAANAAFKSALGIGDSACLGSCPGKALNCLHAIEDYHHDRPPSFCEDCQLAAVTHRALERGERIRERIRLQLTTSGRLREVAIECTALPLTIADQEYVVLLIDSMSRIRDGRPTDPSVATFGMIGHHPAMLELFDIIRQVGPLKVPVLVHGESGTGKELVAQALHQVSPNRSGLMVVLNCGALPDGLLESELFGHVKGAFTGAHRDKRGRFELAHRGTIFLDEIGELSPAMQVKFLRVLQDGSFEPLGSERTTTVDARVVCATNRDLERDVVEGRFRADLFFRLAVVPIRVPALRERISDVPLLSAHFLEQMAEEHRSLATTISDGAMQSLFDHPWPGNVRELENAVRYAAIRARGAPIERSHLPPGFCRSTDRKDQGRAPRRLDAAVVRRALDGADGNRSAAAARLGVSRTTLWRFLRRYPEADPSG